MTSESDAKFSQAIGTTPDVVAPVIAEIRGEVICPRCMGHGTEVLGVGYPMVGSPNAVPCKVCHGTGRKPLPPDSGNLGMGPDAAPADAPREYEVPEPFSESDGPLPLGPALAASCAEALQGAVSVLNERANVSSERHTNAAHRLDSLERSYSLLSARVDMLAADVRRLAGGGEP